MKCLFLIVVMSLRALKKERNCYCDDKAELPVLKSFHPDDSWQISKYIMPKIDADKRG